MPRSTFKGLAKIDLLVIDGPPSSTNPDARFPALEHLVPLLSPKATVILDDVYRDEERKLADAIAKALPNHVLTIHLSRKGNRSNFTAIWKVISRESRFL